MKMTMQDLIVGHYEGALTPSQQQELQSLLAASPEARAMYEHHAVMQEAMEEESERLIPPIALRQATIGAALGVAAESIGGGIAAWFTTKVAVAIGTVVVGGAAAGIILSNSGDDTSANTPPTVTAPAATAPAPVQDNSPVEAAQNTPAGQVDNTDAAPAARPSASASTTGARSAPSGGQNPAAGSSSATSTSSNGNGEVLDLDGDEPTHMGPKTTVKPEGNK